MNLLRNELKEKYSQIPNELITDLTLSSGALRVVLYLFTKPDSWNVYNADICKRLNISEKTLTKYWNELLKSKWLRREQKRNNLGKLQGGYIYRIGIFTVSEESSVSEESYSHSNNIPEQEEETNSIKKNIKKVTNPKNKKEQLISILKEKDLTNINKKSLNEWLEYKEWNYKEIGINKIIGLLKQYTFLEQEEIINKSIISNYKGLFGLNKNTSNNKPQGQYQTRAEKTKAFIEDFYKRKEAEYNQNNSTDIVDAEVIS